MPTPDPILAAHNDAARRNALVGYELLLLMLEQVRDGYPLDRAIRTTKARIAELSAPTEMIDGKVA